MDDLNNAHSVLKLVAGGLYAGFGGFVHYLYDDGGARAIFYVDGVEVASVTQGVPASGTRLAWSVGHGVTSTVSRVLDIDSIAIQS